MVSEHEWFNFKQWLLRSRRLDRLNKLYHKPNVSLTKSMSSCNWECWYPQKNLPLSIHTKDLNWIVLWSWFMTVHSEMSNFYQIFCSCIDTVRNNKFSLDICKIFRHLGWVWPSWISTFTCEFNSQWKKKNNKSSLWRW